MGSLTSSGDEEGFSKGGSGTSDALRPSSNQPQLNRWAPRMGQDSQTKLQCAQGTGAWITAGGWGSQGSHPPPPPPAEELLLLPPPSPGDSSGMRGDSGGTEPPWPRCSRPSGLHVSNGNSPMNVPPRAPQGGKSPDTERSPNLRLPLGIPSPLTELPVQRQFSNGSGVIFTTSSVAW